MLSFTENKNKRKEKAEGKLKQKEELTRQPAWHDVKLEKMQVSIEDKSRLRKLKTTEAETHIKGKLRYTIKTVVLCK